MRLLNRKGQGLTEYGIILLLVLLIGMGVFYSFSIKGQVSALYNQAEYKLSEISGNVVLDLNNPSQTLDSLMKAYRTGVADRSTITNTMLHADVYLDKAAVNLGSDLIKDFAVDPNVDYKAYYYQNGNTYTIQSIVLHNNATGEQYIEYANGAKYDISGSTIEVGTLGRNASYATEANGVKKL